MVLSYRAFLDPFKKLNKNRCYHCILEKPSMWGNPFDLAARTLQTLRSVALVGATTAASGLALFQQLKETQVGHRGCKTRVVRVAKHLVDLRASMKILLCFGWKDDGPLQSRLDSFDSVIFVPTSTKQFVWYNFHHWHPLTTIFLGSFRIHFRKQPVCASFISLTRHSPSMIPWAIFLRTLGKRSRHWSPSMFQSQQPEAAPATFSPVSIHPPRSSVLPWNRLNTVTVDSKDGTDIDFHPKNKTDSTGWLAFACVDVLLVWHHSSTSDFKGALRWESFSHLFGSIPRHCHNTQSLTSRHIPIVPFNQIHQWPPMSHASRVRLLWCLVLWPQRPTCRGGDWQWFDKIWSVLNRSHWFGIHAPTRLGVMCLLFFRI